MGVESSGGHNIAQGPIGDVNNRNAAATGDPTQLAQGYFQITGPTSMQFGGGTTNVLGMTYSQQVDLAQNIPVSRWGGATQSALQANGYFPRPGETLGQMMTRYGEDPSATTAADGSAYTQSVTGTGSDALNQGAGDPLGFSVTQDTGAGSSIGNDQGTPNLGGGVSSAGITDNSAAGMNPNNAPFSGDITNISVAGVNAPASAGVSTAAAPQGTAPQAQGGTGTGGPPIMITNAQQIGDQAAGTIAQGANTAANTLSKSVSQAGQDVQSAEGNFAAAGTSWLGSSFSAVTNLFVRSGFVLLGLVLIIGAFVFFYAERQTGAVANG